MRHEVRLDGRTLTYREAGAGEPFVLIHAFPLNADMWELQLRAVPNGWRLIAPDLRGFRPGCPSAGVTDEPPARTIEDYAADVEALLDRLEIPRAVIGGLSMGGYITFALYRHAPGRFRGMILADTRSAADTEEGRANRRRMQALVDREGAAGVAREILSKLLGEDTRRGRPAVVAHVRAMIEACAPAAITNALECLMNRPDSTPLLASLSCPTLVLVGAQDALTPVAESEGLRALIANSTLVVIPSAGHLSSLEQPEEFNAALTRFLIETC